jgi:hypothetical protein
MVEDRFYEPETVPFDELASDAYDEYLEKMQDEDGGPMSYEEFEDYYWRGI